MIDRQTDRQIYIDLWREKEKKKQTYRHPVSSIFWRILTNTLEEEGLDLGLNGRRNAVGSTAQPLYLHLSVRPGPSLPWMGCAPHAQTAVAACYTCFPGHNQLVCLDAGLLRWFPEV